MTMFHNLICESPSKIHYALVKADLIPHLIAYLNPQSLSFAEAVDIHIYLMSIIQSSLWLITPDGLTQLDIEDPYEQQAIHKTVFQQVLAPSEKYICHLCVNLNSIIDRKLSEEFMYLLSRLLQITPYYQPTMEVVLNMPVVLTIPSSLAFFEDDFIIWNFLHDMSDSQQDWNRTRGDTQQMWKEVSRLLRMEGIEDVIEEKLRNDQAGSFGGWLINNSIRWNNLQGMNAPKPE
ncbi:hypothetical protein BLNAU_8929 [Blattamonas nauphoetae]|uniref:Uncharacterized protein n=1 Tax=Blattamonas nauphoetae TaxID=2049346 RepID=A0ABQ9XXG2_9EUKA|nr:hypothetical protein BLNAU_8929 [Blattamonas nauphoetae]